MMTLRVIGTGSSGNAYVLRDENGNVLILDAGVKAREIMEGIGPDDEICGCVVTHEHKDHSRAVADLAFRGIRIGMSEGTIKAIGAEKTVNVEALRALQTYMYGPYKIMPFGVEHDAAEPMGFLIKHKPTDEQVLYVTDTYYLRYKFPGVDYWIIECNYVDDALPETNAALRIRLLQSHLSLARLQQALEANDLSKTRKIVLVHLSDRRSDEALMVETIENATGGIETRAAYPGETIPLTVQPF